METYREGLNDIDLVIMDIGMPGMGGHQCLQELIRMDPSVKVLIASGYSVKDTNEANAAGFIGKPYQLSDLLRKIREILDQQD